MKVTFWGCRGSLPASYPGNNTRNKIEQILHMAMEEKITDISQIDKFIDDLPFHLQSGFGTNTSCVQIGGGDEIVICDAGSGLRDLGRFLVGKGPKMPKVIHILISHLHWDHIQGFPFFIPAYIQGVTIHIWGCHQNIEDTFVRQQNPPTFPVSLKNMGSKINFHRLDVSKSYDIGGLNVSMIEQPHPGTSYGYRFVKNGQVVIYSTDAEHTDASQSDDYPFLKFIEEADVLIFDGQFNLADHLYTKQNWGHSSNLVGIELAARAQVKKLCLFHSEHTFNDDDLYKFLTDSRRYLNIYDDRSKLDIVISFDGLEIDLDS
ncbi:MAG: MBL fold metallo-hydrolase [Saprospiraceae bacterium]|nr:MBL fold metallo-hydrolase [Saprospiraceae bacterium]